MFFVPFSICNAKVSGIKRHIAVDTQGLPHALAVTTADVTDRKGCLLALKRELDNLGAIQKILADDGYKGTNQRYRRPVRHGAICFHCL